ncbi:MAG: cyclic nucleotide-binding domain-containing protein [bacterium]|nr:cyclic nucleotide-binding domain-containing protein [bacterium]
MSSVTTTTEAGPQDVSLEELGLFHIFRGLDESRLAMIRSIIEVEEVKAEEAVIRDGDVGDTFYLLLKGEVEVSKALVMRMSRQEVDQTDKSLIRLNAAPHPEFGKPAFGEMALFNETCKRSATVAATKASMLGVIRHGDFVELCEQDPEIGYRVFMNIAQVLSNRLDKANQDVLNLTTALSFVLAPG